MGQHSIYLEYQGVCTLLFSEARFPVFLFVQKSAKPAVLWTEDEPAWFVPKQSKQDLSFCKSCLCFPLSSLQCQPGCVSFSTHLVFPSILLYSLHWSTYFFWSSSLDPSCLPLLAFRSNSSSQRPWRSEGATEHPGKFPLPQTSNYFSQSIFKQLSTIRDRSVIPQTPRIIFNYWESVWKKYLHLKTWVLWEGCSVIREQSIGMLHCSEGTQDVIRSWIICSLWFNSWSISIVLQPFCSLLVFTQRAPVRHSMHSFLSLPC